MTKRNRFIILIFSMAVFFIVAPILVFYSMGERFDFAKMKVLGTGGIYVRTFPPAEQIIIDSKITEKPGMFSNWIFVQSLLPAKHTVLIEKTGYYDYSKTLPVQEKEVTKLENVILFKKNTQFAIVADKTQSPFNIPEKFIIKNNNLYYSNSPENSGISAAAKTIPILKKITAFSLENNNIIWLGTDGFLYKSDLASLSVLPVKMTLTPLKIVKTGSYKIISGNKNIFVNDNGNLLLLNAETNNLDNFSSQVKNAIISSDSKNVVYYDDNYIYISPIAVSPVVKNALYKSSEKINNCVWLNNDYVIFSAGNEVMISEIDYRGNANIITLPQTITIFPDEKIDLKNPDIFFSQSTGKLYISTNNILLLSEKITP